VASPDDQLRYPKRGVSAFDAQFPLGRNHPRNQGLPGADETRKKCRGRFGQTLSNSSPDYVPKCTAYVSAGPCLRDFVVPCALANLWLMRQHLKKPGDSVGRCQGRLQTAWACPNVRQWCQLGCAGLSRSLCPARTEDAAVPRPISTS